MIAYDLQCSNGHLFEGWFDDSRAFETQQKKGLLTCPICNDAQVSRIPSTFAIRSAGAAAVSGRPAGNAEVAEMHGRIVEFIEKNFDNVGTEFAKEALKIHYGAAEPRNIRGTSTDQEEETLRKEGIDFVKIPMPTRAEPDA